MLKRDSDRIIALIPAWNEASTVGGIVQAAVLRLPVLVVDDGSTDGTAETARRAGALVISHPTNRRKGAALKTGFAWALAKGFDAVLTMDADGQHHPDDIDRLLAAYRDRRGDLIIGERDFSQMPWPNRYTTPLGSLLLSRALDTRVTDNQSGFRLLTRGLLESMRLSSDGYEMEVEMIWEAVRLGMSIAWVPIQTIYFRDRKSGFRPLMDTLLFLKMVLRIWRGRLSRNPRAREEICARASMDQQESG